MAVPMFNEHPIEMGMKGREHEIVRAARRPTVGMAARFAEAFPGDRHRPSASHNIVKAIASFERTLLSADSPFDRYLYRDDRTALSPAALRGMDLFFSSRLRCSECHASFNLSGPVTFERATAACARSHNTGLYDVDGARQLSRRRPRTGRS